MLRSHTYLPAFLSLPEHASFALICSTRPSFMFHTTAPTNVTICVFNKDQKGTIAHCKEVYAFFQALFISSVQNYVTSFITQVASTWIRLTTEVTLSNLFSSV